MKEEKGVLIHALGELLHKSPRFQVFLVVLLFVDVVALFGAIFIDAEVPRCFIVTGLTECTLENEFNYTLGTECYPPLFDVKCKKVSKCDGMALSSRFGGLKCNASTQRFFIFCSVFTPKFRAI